MFEYPPVGFHFGVAFQLAIQLPLYDSFFQEVSGLDAEVEMESFAEGGQNRFTWQLPKKVRYSDITLKRGMLVGSGITLWCRNAVENFVFEPVNVTIALLNEYQIPLQAWYVVNAIPKKWSVSGFNAQENSIVIESLTLSYQYFNVISADAVAGAVAGAIASAF